MKMERIHASTICLFDNAGKPAGTVETTPGGVTNFYTLVRRFSREDIAKLYYKTLSDESTPAGRVRICSMCGKNYFRIHSALMDEKHYSSEDAHKLTRQIFDSWQALRGTPGDRNIWWFFDRVLSREDFEKEYGTV